MAKTLPLPLLLPLLLLLLQLRLVPVEPQPFDCSACIANTTVSTCCACCVGGVLQPDTCGDAEYTGCLQQSDLYKPTLYMVGGRNVGSCAIGAIATVGTTASFYFASAGCLWAALRPPSACGSASTSRSTTRVARSIRNSTTASATASASLPPYCNADVYRTFPGNDLMGTSLGRAPPVSSERACQLTCCNTPQCTGYAFNSGQILLCVSVASCFLLANVTQPSPTTSCPAAC